ncbi:MAG: class I SAM-dependent methyltransferase [Nitrospiraceae bacterium]|nr:class I SAM-dependent methyltransferase [Nitrospiraceae bacterium]
MCNTACLRFGEKLLSREEIAGKRVIEVGAYDVNGSLRSYIESFGPAEYVGVDIEQGYGVDVVCTAEDLLQRFGKGRFDVVVSTELLEHVRDWRTVISNMKNLCAPGGVILITTRSKGYPYHGWPYDFWRFETGDMERIFDDCEVQGIESDPIEPGVFVKAKKSAAFTERSLSDIAVYSVVTDGPVTDIPEDVLKSFLERRADEYRLLERQTARMIVRKKVRDWYWKAKKRLAGAGASA